MHRSESGHRTQIRSIDLEECDAIVLLDDVTGHGGEGGRYSSMDVKSLECAFLVDRIERNLCDTDQWKKES